HYRADDSVRWIFFADLADEQGQRIYGETTASEFFPRRARPRRCDRDPVAGLPDARGRTRSADVPALVRPSWSAAVRDSHFGGVLLLDAAADRHSSQPSGLPDLRGSGDPCLWSRHATGFREHHQERVSPCPGCRRIVVISDNTRVAKKSDLAGLWEPGGRRSYFRANTTRSAPKRFSTSAPYQSCAFSCLSGSA